MALELKIQAIQPTNTSPGDYSIAHEFPISDDETLQKRGQLFLIMHLSSSGDFDLSSIAKLFIDNFKEKYYTINELSPLQNMERSFKTSLDTIENFRSKDDQYIFMDPQFSTNIQISIANIWNRVLYISNFGNCANYLIRGSGARDLNDGVTMFKNDSHINSLILEDEDIVVIGSTEFQKKYPAKTIIDNLHGLNTHISTSAEGVKMAVMLIKCGEVTSKTKKSKESKTPHITGKLFNIIDNLKTKFKQERNLSDEFKVYQSKKASPISSIAGTTDDKSSKSTSITRPIRINSNQDRFKIQFALGFGVLLLLSGVILFSLNEVRNRPLAEDAEDEFAIEVQYPKPDEEKENESNVIILADIFYDSSTDNKKDIDAFYVISADDILFYSKKDEILYKYSKPKDYTTTIIEDIKTPDIIRCYSRYCFVTSNKIVYVFDPNTTDKIDKYPFNNTNDIIDIGFFGESIYVLTLENIFTFKLGAVTPTITPWIKSTDRLSKPQSMMIDRDIYIIDNGLINRYSAGVKRDYTVDQNVKNLNTFIGQSDSFFFMFNQPDSLIYEVSKLTGKLNGNAINLNDYGFNFTVNERDLFVLSGKTKSGYVLNDGKVYKFEIK